MDRRCKPACNASAFDNDAALELVRAVLREMCDGDWRIDRDTRIDTFFNEVCGADSLEYLDFMFRMESSFGVRMTNADWTSLADSKHSKTQDERKTRAAREFTFGRLAEILALRANITQIEPVTICGSRSLAAGAFCAIEKDARHFRNGADGFGPSTRILDQIEPNDLPNFWKRIRTHCPSRIPRLDATSGRSLTAMLQGGWGFMLCLVIAASGVFSYGLHLGVQKVLGDILFVGIGGILSLLVSSILSATLSFACDSITRFRHRRGVEFGMLPHDIETFGDLARLLAGERGGWCDSCGYDLTGVESGRCPECGRETTRPLAMPFPARATIQKTGR